VLSVPFLFARSASSETEIPSMTLRENELQRLRRMSPSVEDDKVLTFRQWCEINGFSPRTGRRILAGDNGPIVTQLSQKLLGVTVGNNRAWQAARARART
jgi:hypothetical protein